MTVIIPTHRRPDRLARLLTTLSEQTIGTGRFEVIVVDDCSGDHTCEVLRFLDRQLPYALRSYTTPANRGPGPARNIGWRAARAGVIAFTDDDCRPEADWLEQGLGAINANPRLGLVQGHTAPVDIAPLLSNRWNHSVIVDSPTPYFETCNIFYRKEALEAGGGFGEHYSWWGGWYCEDTLAGWGAIDAGWERGFAPSARVETEAERRSLKWWIKKSLSLYIEVEVARRHPGFRQEAYWRSWAPRRYDAAFVAGSLGLLFSRRHPWAAVLVIPYVVWRRPPIRHGRFARQCLETLVVDTARTVGIVYGGLKHRMVVF